MNKNKEKFICTTSKETAEKLWSNGFVCVYESRNFWMFLNNKGNFNFDDLDHIIFSDKIYT